MGTQVLLLCVAVTMVTVVSGCSVGRQFITAFLPNYLESQKGQKLQLAITAQDSAAEIIVRVKSLRWFSPVVKVGRGETRWVTVPNQAELRTPGPSPHTVLVTSNTDVSVVSFNNRDNTLDSSVLLPVSSLGKVYVVFTPDSGPRGMKKLLAVVNGAWANTLTLLPAATVKLQGGAVWRRGQAVTVRLAPYQAFLYQSSNSLTGTQLRAQRPLAVLAGHQCSALGGSCDHVYAQLPPLHSLSTSFLVPSMHSSAKAKDWVHVVAWEDGTVLIVRQEHRAQAHRLGAGAEWKQKVHPSSPLVILSNRRVLVMYYSVDQDQDPFLTSILPTAQLSAGAWGADTLGGFQSTVALLAERAGVKSVQVCEESNKRRKKRCTRPKWKVFYSDRKYVWANVALSGRKQQHVSVEGDAPMAMYVFGKKKYNGYGTTGVCSSATVPTPPPDPCDGITCREKEECKKGVCVHVSTATCWALGDPHYLSFDGRRFDFQGTCTYVMATVTDPPVSLVPFTVTTKNDHRGSRSVAFVRRVSVSVFNTTLVISRHRGKVEVDGELAYLPVSLAEGKVTVLRHGSYAVVRTTFGLEVRYDWNSRLYITAPSSYYRHLGGLCGNYNGDRRDDLTDPKGVSSVLTMAQSWKVEDSDLFCHDNCGGRCPSCSPQLQARYRGGGFCGVMAQEEGPFSGCHTALSPDGFLDNCVFDVCINKGMRQQLCEALGSYAEACRAAGGKVHPHWRTTAGCPLACPVNSHYVACGTACPASCSDLDAPSRCRAPCLEDCQCDPGFVLSGDACVPRGRCGCSHQGRYYPPGATFWSDRACRQRCRCDPRTGQVACGEAGCRATEVCGVRRGVRDCYPTSCATCRGAGDPHYRSFDGRRFDFQGTCTYVLSKLVGGGGEGGEGLEPYEVLVQNQNRGRNKAVSYTKMVTITVYNHTIIMSRDYPGKVLVDGQYVNLPWEGAGGRLTLFRRGYFGVVKAALGLTLSFNWNSHVSLTLCSSYSGQVGGLCGNWNSQRNDDLLTPNKTPAKTPTAFGDSWKVGEDPGCSSECEGQTCPQCSPSQKLTYQSPRYCGLISDPRGPFRRCHAHLAPGDHLDDCVFDLCLYRGHASALCSALSAYTSACQDAGAALDQWRTDDFCPPSCQANSHYEVCAPGCPQTCSGMTEPEACEGAPCSEGCVCDDGFLLSDSVCVPLAECGCQDGGLYYREGQVVHTGGRCQRRCVCRDGQLQCQDSSCGAHEKCLLQGGVQSCVPEGVGTCRVGGARSVRSFDGRVFSLHGDCVFKMAQVVEEEEEEEEEEGMTPFSVMLRQMTKAGDAMATRSVEVQVYDIRITLAVGIIWEILVDDITTNLPLTLADGKLRAYQSGVNIVVETDCGLKVTYDTVGGVALHLPSTYHGSTSGLCGNYNDQTGDDFLLANGTQASSAEAFTSGWAATEGGAKCETGCGSKCDGPLDQIPKECDIITDAKGPLAGCHAKIPSKGYYEECVKEVSTEGGGKGGQGGGVLCRHIQAYVSQCQAAGGTVESWRSDKLCPPKCPARTHYEVCADTCSTTCASLSEPAPCPPCQEGCQCDQGLVSDGGDCVPLERCGCVVDGRYYKSGHTVVREDCSETCSCEQGRFTCSASNCSQGEECRTKGGVLACSTTDPCEDVQCLEQEDCVVEDGSAQCQARSKAVCWAFGDPHFRTFDGRSFSFQGTCSYLLANTTGVDPPLHPFSISARAERRGNLEGSFIHSASLEVMGHLITVISGERGTVEIDGERSILPVVLESGSVSVTESGIRGFITTDFGLQATFDWASLFAVTVSSSYYGNLQGLCGNYNGNPGDDITTSGGVATENITAWAGSWSVESGDPFCWHACEGSCPTCSDQERALYSGPKYCGILGDGAGPFAQCHQKVPVKEFALDCLYDVCLNEGRQEVLCEALASYVADCQEAGGSVSPLWRKAASCPLPCPDHSHYDLCGTSCPATCAQPQPCPKVCVEGCQCDQGYVLSGEKCVTKETACGCTYDGRYHLPGAAFWADVRCETRCVCDAVTQKAVCEARGCKSGERCGVVGGVRDCYPVSWRACAAQGDPHFSSFDGRRFDFQGNCVYKMAAACSADPDLEPFQVALENQNRGSTRVSYARAVTVSLYGNDYTLTRDYPNKVLVDGILTSLPFNSINSKVQVYHSSRLAVLETHFLKVSYDWSNAVKVKLADTYHNGTCGLCGNMNGDPGDDLRLANGKTAPSATEFGSSYWLEDVPGCSHSCKDCAPPLFPGVPPPAYTKVCDVITAKTGPLRDCLGRVDAARYHDDCVYDMTLNNGQQAAACDIISGYVEECQEAGGVIEAWRTNDFCHLACPENSVYSLSAPGCPATCYSMTLPLRCSSRPAEGCQCRQGYLLSDGRCVHLKDCGCRLDGRYYQSGQKFYLEEQCQHRCTCSSGTIACLLAPCHRRLSCGVEQGVRGCYQKPKKNRHTLWFHHLFKGLG